MLRLGGVQGDGRSVLRAGQVPGRGTRRQGEVQSVDLEVLRLPFVLRPARLLGTHTACAFDRPCSVAFQGRIISS